MSTAFAEAFQKEGRSYNTYSQIREFLLQLKIESNAIRRQFISASTDEDKKLYYKQLHELTSPARVLAKILGIQQPIDNEPNWSQLYSEIITLSNFRDLIMPVKHSELTRANDSSTFMSKCPKCHIGTLLVNRNQTTLVLEEFDHCILCGQMFKYLDINELRKNDWASKLKEEKKE